MDAEGWVLAGGRSLRMGQDKALMMINGRTMLETVAGNVLRGIESVTVIGNREKYGALGLPLIEDAAFRPKRVASGVGG